MNGKIADAKKKKRKTEDGDGEKEKKQKGDDITEEVPSRKVKSKSGGSERWQKKRQRLISLFCSF